MQSTKVQTINKYVNQSKQNQCTADKYEIWKNSVLKSSFLESSKWFKELCKNLKDLDQMQINTDKLIQNRNQIKFDTRKTIKKTPITQKQFFWKTD